uniref:Uncharacterized protein n=1 Tax=Podoviridae sp. ctQyH19 TaxID=2825249 RepID=A0A8S5UQZ3_9CAUD|nr:MAG TPA: hypothetical protein [Podoviridae sp. ctQyH19]
MCFNKKIKMCKSYYKSKICTNFSEDSTLSNP